MLSNWLSPLSIADFMRDHLSRAPYAQPSAARDAVPLFGWDTFARVLRSTPPPDLLVVQGGRMIETTAPRTLEAAKLLMDRGHGFVIRRGERNDRSLAMLSSAVGRELEGPASIQLFVTRGGTNGFGWHYDFEDVFIVQTAGSKEYLLRANTVDRDTPRDRQPDFSAFRRETGPLMSVELHAGDWLYIPARWWHMAKCLRDSLSISIGVFPRESPATATPVAETR